MGATQNQGLPLEQRVDGRLEALKKTWFLFLPPYILMLAISIV